MVALLARRRGPSTGLAAWVATLAGVTGAIAGLHTLGSHPAFATEIGNLWSWIGTHSAERVLLVLGRYTALSLGYWTAGSLLASTLARLCRLPALIRSLDRVTLPAIRRIADRVVAVSLAVSSITASGTGIALAGDQSTQDSEPAAVVHIHQAETLPHGGYVPVPAADAPLVPVPTEEDLESVGAPLPTAESTNDPQPRGGIPGPAPDPHRADHDEADPRLDPASAHEVQVVAGDNLWVIAARHLERVIQRDATDAETATYWAHLVSTNRTSLRSGDPDRIYPGEIVTCPAIANVGLTK